ncbi:MAG: curli production assembly protein CsgG [Acidobacteria bacterium]|nr:curli production assembly protein CsgG [Acidobacteriota bacterium]
MTLSLLLALGTSAELIHAQQASAPPTKKRVAVMNFDYGTVQNSVASIFGTNQDVGKGISDLLVQKLVQDGQYSVIERNAIDKVLTEQNLSNSDRADATTAAKIGRLLGVDAVILGAVTQFGRDDKNTTIGGGGLGAVTNKFGIGGLQKRNAKASVGISARVVDTSTAEVLAAVTGNGTSTRSGTSLLGAGGGGGSGGGVYDMTSQGFGETILGQAVHQAVNSVADQLDKSATILPSRKTEISGLVADVSGTTLILNVGSKAGVKVGDTLAVSRPVRTVKDPSTGKVIKTITSEIGTAKITDADESSATATYIGSDTPKVGDSVKSH